MIAAKATTLNDENTQAPADRDVEELSDTELIDDGAGEKGAPTKDEPARASAGGPVVGRYAVPLPKPNPPPRPEAFARPVDRAPQAPSDADEVAENLPTVDLRQLAAGSPPFPPAAPPPAPQPEALPPAQPTEPALREPQAQPAGVGTDANPATVPRSARSPVLSAVGGLLRRGSRLLSTRDRVYDGVRRLLHERRRHWPVVVLAPAVLGAGIGIVAIGLARSRGHDGAGRSPAPPAAAAPVVPPSDSVRSPVSDPPSPTCVRTGESHVIAPSATLTAGIELREFGGNVAVGFAATEHQAMLVRLDPKTLAVVESSTSASTQPIRRVTPVAGPDGHLSVAVDVDRKGDSLRGRRTLSVDPPLQIGVADAHLAWAPMNREVAGELWPLDRDDAVEALRGVRSTTNPPSVVIAFRSAGAEWLGAAQGKANLAAKGQLFRVEGLGPTVGSPALAASDGVGLMAWADRASSDDPWRLRWVRFKEGDAPSTPLTFTVPAGGNGEQAMSPALAVVPGGRFLLTWTQGPASVHQVRGLTIWADGTPLGEPLDISTPGSNAGQSQAVIAADGRGVVAFLQSSPAGFEVAVTAIACGE